MRKLTVSSGPAAGRSVEVEDELVVGRENADFNVDDPEASRRHAVVRPMENGVEVEDLGSLNGTFVNGRRIEGPETLGVSGVIRVGRTEIQVDLAMPSVTKPHLVPEPPSEPDVAAPDVTAPRAIPEQPPDVTAPRAIPEQPPDVTAPRAIPEQPPDVTAPRAIPEQPPDVTAPRAIPEQPPDVTAPRRVPQGPPPEPAPARSRPGSEPAEDRDPQKVLIAVIALLAVAVIVLLILLLA